MQCWMCMSFLFIGFTRIYRCLSEDLYMQIIAPARSTTSTGLTTAVRTALSEANRRSFRPRNPLTYARLTLQADVHFINAENPTPNELLDLFCDKIFANNASLITMISYSELTSQSNDYVLNLAKYLRYPVISWDPLYPGGLEVCTSQCFCYLFLFITNFVLLCFKSPRNQYY